MGKRKLSTTTNPFDDDWDKPEEPVVYPEPEPYDPDDRQTFVREKDGWIAIHPSVNEIKRRARTRLQACIRRMNCRMQIHDIQK